MNLLQQKDGKMFITVYQGENPNTVYEVDKDSHGFFMFFAIKEVIKKTGKLYSGKSVGQYLEQGIEIPDNCFKVESGFEGGKAVIAHSMFTTLVS